MCHFEMYKMKREREWNIYPLNFLVENERPIHSQIMQNCNRKFQKLSYSCTLFIFLLRGVQIGTRSLQSKSNCSTLQSSSNGSNFFKLYFYLLFNISLFYMDRIQVSQLSWDYPSYFLLFAMLRIFSPASLLCIKLKI